LVTVGGTADNVVVNGGTGVDKVAFDTTNKIKTATFKLGLGDNEINFAGLGDTTNGSLGTVTGKAGLAINLSNDNFIFLPNTANTTTVEANSVAQYEAGGSVKNVVANGFTATIDAGTVKTVTGTAQDDFIKANNTSGNIIVGGGGADTIILGSGADVVVYTAATDGGSGGDTVTNFTSGVDKVAIANALTTDATAAGSAVVASAADADTAVAVTLAGADVLFIGRTANANAVDSGSDSLSVAKSALGTAASIATLVNDQFTITASAGADLTIIAVEASDDAGHFAVYHWTPVDAADATVNAAELKLLGIFDGNAVAATDFVIV
jgi:hypothetical protein